MDIQIGHVGKSRQRNAERSKGHGRGVSDERQFGRFQGLESETDHHGAGDGHRRAETGATLDERAERKSNEQRLDATIAGETRDSNLETLKLSGFHGQLINEDRVQHDPADGKETERRAKSAGGQGESGGHAVNKY